jgi:hypothetical protein
MRKITLLIVIIAVSVACTKEDVIPSDPPVLVFPAKDALCTTGTNITNTESTVTFSWNSVDNAASYNLTIENLLTKNIIKQSSTTNQLAVTLAANTPYKWSVEPLSKSAKAGTVSESWKFYNAGLGIISYAPFPATMIAPTYGQVVSAVGGKVTLTWMGNDVDNDISTYTMYCDKNPTPLQQRIASSTATSFDMTVTAGTYYWYVITTDKQGNQSRTENYKFTVN